MRLKMRLLAISMLWNFTVNLACAQILQEKKPEIIILTIATLDRVEFEMQNEFLLNLFKRCVADINSSDEANAEKT